MEHNKAYCTPIETIPQYSLSSTQVAAKRPEKRKTNETTSELDFVLIIIVTIAWYLDIHVRTFFPCDKKIKNIFYNFLILIIKNYY